MLDIIHGQLKFMWFPGRTYSRNKRIWFCWALRYSDGSYELPFPDGNVTIYYWRQRLNLYNCQWGFHELNCQHFNFDGSSHYKCCRCGHETNS